MTFSPRQREEIVKACDRKLHKYFTEETIAELRDFVYKPYLPLADIQNTTEKVLTLAYSGTLTFSGRVQLIRDIENILRRYVYQAGSERN